MPLQRTRTALGATNAPPRYMETPPTVPTPQKGPDVNTPTPEEVELYPVPFAADAVEGAR